MKIDGLTHPKTKRLGKLLNVPHYAAVGILECLFGFTAQYADNGHIGKYSEDVIAEGVNWDRAPNILIEALRAAGFVDGHGEHLVLHDWADHCPDYVKKRWKRKAAAGGDRRSPEATDDRLPGHPFQVTPDQVDELFDILRNLQGFVPPSRAPDREQYVTDLLQMHGLEKMQLACGAFPLSYTWSSDFVPHLQWLAAPGRVADLLEGRYGPPQRSQREKYYKKMIAQGEAKLAVEEDEKERGLIAEKLRFLKADLATHLKTTADR